MDGLWFLFIIEYLEWIYLLKRLWGDYIIGEDNFILILFFAFCFLGQARYACLHAGRSPAETGSRARLGRCHARGEESFILKLQLFVGIFYYFCSKFVVMHLKALSVLILQT